MNSATSNVVTTSLAATQQIRKKALPMAIGVLLWQALGINAVNAAPADLSSPPGSSSELSSPQLSSSQSGSGVSDTFSASARSNAQLSNTPPTETMEEAAANNSRLRYSQALTDYRTAIEEIEAREGAWGNALAEQLTGLGRAYQSRGQHDEAISIFERAAHVDRINQGLYSLTQAPIIERQIESLVARGNWEEVHDRHQYLYWIHQRSYGEADPRMLPVIDKLGKWYLNDYAMNPDKRQPEHLIDAHDLFAEASEIISKEYGENDLRLVEPLRGLALSSWYFSAYNPNMNNQIDNGRYNNQLGADFASEQPNHLVRNDFGSIRSTSYVSPEVDNQLLRYIRTSYVDGKDSISRVINIYQNNPDAPAGAAAAAKVELADWQLLWDKYHAAKLIYRDAYESLAKDDATKTKAAKFFAYPVALPAMSLLETNIEEETRSSMTQQEGDDAGRQQEPLWYVLVQYDVDQYGTARNINVLEQFPEDGSHSMQVKRSLQATRFRPRLLEGEPVTAKGIVQKFIFSTK